MNNYFFSAALAVRPQFATLITRESKTKSRRAVRRDGGLFRLPPTLLIVYHSRCSFVHFKLGAHFLDL